MLKRRIRTPCNHCLQDIFVEREAQFLGAPGRCALCGCYIDGDLTPSEALAQTMQECNLSRRKARVYVQEWLLAEGRNGLPFPQGRPIGGERGDGVPAHARATASARPE